MRKAIILICALAWLLTGCLRAAPQPGVETPEPAPEEELLGYQGGNIGAGGLICGGGDGYVYYRSESDGWQLYRARPDGTGKRRISTQVVENINVLNGWVWFLDHRDGNSIWRIRTDGTGAEKLVEGWCGNLYVAESGIWFDRRDENNVAHVYRADTDGKNPELLVPEHSLAYYFNDRVYYSDSRELGILDLRSGDKKILVTGNTHNVTVDHSGLYYWAVDRGEFSRQNPQGGGETVLQQGGDYYNFSGGSLLYVGISSNGNGPCHVAYRLDTETGEVTALLEEANEFFDLHGHWTGITFRQFQEDPESVPPRYLDPRDGGLKDCFNESLGYVYDAEGILLMRGTLRDSLLTWGRPDCIVRLDGGVSLWD